MKQLQSKHLAPLRKRLECYPGHLLSILDGAVLSYGAKDNPLRFTNTGNGLRELLRELFTEISPDNSIKTCSWYKPDPSSKSGVTRRHRTLFAVYSFLNPARFPKNFVSEVDMLAGEISKRVDELSKFTHVTKASLQTPETMAASTFDSTLGLFLDLFEAIDVSRDHLRDALEIELQNHLSKTFTNDFFDDLDVLSTHTRPQDAEDVSVNIKSIGQDVIRFSGTGSVSCDLQYGSDGDCRRGDGLEFSMSFPFKFSGRAQTDDPAEVSVGRNSIEIDTSSFYE